MEAEHNCVSVISHYDALIDENNDPFHDPAPLREYMDKWDGQAFIDELKLNKNKTALEIGVGTGRLAAKVSPYCREFYGIDVSPKTIARAAENLAGYPNVRLITGDFMTYSFSGKFDAVYSSLTFMHIADKAAAIKKAAGLLNPNGRFALSCDKNQSGYIEMNGRAVKIYPDDPGAVSGYIEAAGLVPEKRFESEFAHIFIAVKP